MKYNIEMTEEGVNNWRPTSEGWPEEALPRAKEMARDIVMGHCRPVITRIVRDEGPRLPIAQYHRVPAKCVNSYDKREPTLADVKALIEARILCYKQDAAECVEGSKMEWYTKGSIDAMRELLRSINAL